MREIKSESIRRQISNIFGVLIEENEWDSIFKQFDAENRLNDKNIIKILLVILKRLEELENEK